MDNRDIPELMELDEYLRRFVNNAPSPAADTRDNLLFGEMIVTTPMIVVATAVRRMPKSWGAKKKERRNWTYTMATPDVDNIIGAIMDTLMDDDSGVVSETCTKIWGYESELRIMLIEVDELDKYDGEP